MGHNASELDLVISGLFCAGIALNVGCLHPPVPDVEAQERRASSEPRAGNVAAVGTSNVHTHPPQDVLHWTSPLPSRCPDVAAPTDAGTMDAAAPSGVTDAPHVIGRMRPRFRACYERLLGRDSVAQGRVELTLVVDCDGSIHSMHAEAKGLDRWTLQCVMDAILHDRFAPLLGGTKAMVFVPITFVRKD